MQRKVTTGWLVIFENTTTHLAFDPNIFSADKLYYSSFQGRGQLKCDDARAKTIIRLSAKRTSPFKSAEGVSSVDYWQSRSADQRTAIA